MVAVLSAYDLAAVALVGAVVVVALLVPQRRMAVRFGKIEATVDGIDKAVNNVGDGEPTLYALAKSASLTAGEALTLGHRTAGKLEEVGELVVNHLAHHQAEVDAASRRG